MRHVYEKATRTPEERARLKADRERYQRDKPTPEQLLTESGQADFVPLGELIALRTLMASLKAEREHQGLTLTALAKRAGIDQAALCRLETGVHPNPTLDTLYRIALALGKQIVCVLHDLPEKPARAKKALQKR